MSRISRPTNSSEKGKSIHANWIPPNAPTVANRAPSLGELARRLERLERIVYDSETTASPKDTEGLAAEPQVIDLGAILSALMENIRIKSENE